MGILSDTIDNALDRYRKLRLGKMTSDIDSLGFVSVEWLDGDIGGQNKIQLSYPVFTNTDSAPWGVELGYGNGTVGVFGFLTDNHAVLLTTVIARNKKGRPGLGYLKTGNNGIKSGELRFTSKFQGQMYFDLAGNVIISNPKNAITLDNTGAQVTIDAGDGASLTMGLAGAGVVPPVAGLTATASTFVIKVNTGNIQLNTGYGSSININEQGVQIEVGSPANGVTPIVTVGGNFPVLYSIKTDGSPISDFTEIGVSNTLNVGGTVSSVD